MLVEMLVETSKDTEEEKNITKKYRKENKRMWKAMGTERMEIRRKMMADAKKKAAKEVQISEAAVGDVAEVRGKNGERQSKRQENDAENERRRRKYSRMNVGWKKGRIWRVLQSQSPRNQRSRMENEFYFF